MNNQEVSTLNVKSLKNLIFIGLGSNLGNSVLNLDQAVRYLQTKFNIPITTSSIYYSEPVEVIDQPWFYNQVACFEYTKAMTPTLILKYLKEIEINMGRVISYRYGPRLIDLDLLFFKNWIFENHDLSVPHPKVEERAFVVAPILELVTDFINPRTHHNLQDILNNVPLRQCKKL